MASESSCTTVPLPYDILSDRKGSFYKNHVLLKAKCKSRPRYYICLGALVHAVNKQIEKKQIGNDSLYFLASRYAKDLHKWLCEYKYKELFTNYIKSLAASIALFAIGIKLASELPACNLM